MRRRLEFAPELFPLVLVGLPGAGKTTVARHLANRLGIATIDSDAEIKRRARMTIPEIFAAHGEPGFRRLEYKAIKHAISLAQGVMALGGGALTYAPTRELLRKYTVIYLQTSPLQALARIGDGSGRPLFADQPDGELAAKMQRLYQERAATYRSCCDYRVDTDGRTPDQIVDAIIAILEEQSRVNSPHQPALESPDLAEPVRIPVGPGPDYEVTIGAGLGHLVAAKLSAKTRRVLVVHPQALADQAEMVASSLGHLECVTYVHPEGEDAKTAQVLEQAWQVLGANRFTRTDAVITIGGGATTDLGGFIAATWLRGIDVIHLPTTLLGMVDAAIGGKTGINTEFGKNLVGAFHPPRAVICDLDFLQTLSRRDLCAGMAEVLKCGWIRDPQILELAAAGPVALLGEDRAEAVTGPAHCGPGWDIPQGVPTVRRELPGQAVIAQLVARAVAVKAEIVTADLRESSLRELLNYGHTGGHAVEKLSGYQLRHGEAISVGMVFAAEVGAALGLVRADLLAQHRELLQLWELPISWDGATAAEVIEVMRSDKKVRADEIRMVILNSGTGPAQVQSVGVREIASTELLTRAWDRVS